MMQAGPTILGHGNDRAWRNGTVAATDADGPVIWAFSPQPDAAPRLPTLRDALYIPCMHIFAPILHRIEANLALQRGMAAFWQAEVDKFSTCL